MTQTTIQARIEEMVNRIDAKNAPYIVTNHRIADDIASIIRYDEKGDTQMVEACFRWLEEKVQEFDSLYLTPANVEVGDGISQCFYSDRHACTIVKKTAQSITVQRDKATRITTPEFVPGGFAGHCTNNDSIEYTYEANPEASLVTFRWSKKEGRYKNGYSTAIKGRHEKYDYNF